MIDFMSPTMGISYRMNIFDVMHHQIGEAIHYLHVHNWYHLDIKLDNILFDKAKHFKLCDYGSVRQTTWLHNPRPFNVGTPYYQPPEAVFIHGHPLCLASKIDVYAFGCSLLYLLINTFITQHTIFQWFQNYKNSHHAFSNMIDYVQRSDVIFPHKKTRNVQKKLNILYHMLYFDPSKRSIPRKTL